MDPEEDTFIASAQSPTQQRLIQEHSTEQPLFVEGPYPVYLRDVRQNYFLLRAEPNVNALMKQKQQEKADEDDESGFFLLLHCVHLSHLKAFTVTVMNPFFNLI